MYEHKYDGKKLKYECVARTKKTRLTQREFEKQFIVKGIIKRYVDKSLISKRFLRKSDS